MANASLASNYEHIVIDKGGTRVDLKRGTTSFDYYESIFSPHITALMSFVDTGGSTKFNPKYQSQNKLGTIYDALPLTNNEKVEVKIRSKLGTLDFIKYPFYVNGSSNPQKESNREAVALSLISKPGKDSIQSTVFQKYNSKISDSVKLLLKFIDVPENKIHAIESTKNSYSFIGNSREVFQNIIDLSPKSIPENGDPGFFFYETQDGFNFRSIDSLISQEPKATYRRTDVLTSGVEDDNNDYKILSSTITRNQDLTAALKSGVYISRTIFWNPKTFESTERIEKIKLKNSLGKDVEVPDDLTGFSRTHYKILDIGMLEPGVTGEKNNSPEEYQAKSSTRYNILFSQILQVQVPCNPNLRAGDIIKCEFETITQDSKVLNASQIGHYLIVNLCHHFDPLRSFTSMTVVRDTYGIYTSKK
jgi:hypothetical protein